MDRREQPRRRDARRQEGGGSEGAGNRSGCRGAVGGRWTRPGGEKVRARCSDTGEALLAACSPRTSCLAQETPDDAVPWLADRAPIPVDPSHRPLRPPVRRRPVGNDHSEGPRHALLGGHCSGGGDDDDDERVYGADAGSSRGRLGAARSDLRRLRRCMGCRAPAGRAAQRRTDCDRGRRRPARFARR